MRPGVRRDALASFVSSAVGLAVMNPVDVIRTRLYNQPRASDGRTGALYVAAQSGVRAPRRRPEGHRFCSATLAMHIRGAQCRGRVAGHSRLVHSALQRGRRGRGVCAKWFRADIDSGGSVRCGAWFRYGGVLESVWKVGRAEGVLAFWKGFVAHYLRVGPYNVLAFIFIGVLQRNLTPRTHD